MSHAKYVCAGLLLAVSVGAAHAAVVTPGVGVSVTQSWAYANYDGGDFVFSTSVAGTGCGNGWYIKASDPGYRSEIAVVLTAQASGLQVMLYGDNSDIWSCSPSGQYCRVVAIGLSS
jgi:hypothetical protein